VERAVTGDESVAIARGYDGIADYLLLDSLRASDRQIGALGIVHDWTIQPAHCRACSHTGHSCRRPRAGRMSPTLSARRAGGWVDPGLSL